ncbi:MAG TPA: IS3 family transposase, partial [Porphyromonadaceae bacterium]|nr:IS3 family transposase [Porphyromonadaceae bacterium]
KLGYQVSRKRIARLMRKNGLVSNYTVAHYKVHKSTCNQTDTPNVVDRGFDNKEKLEVVVSDLTYIRVGCRWNYVCTLIDLHNREIIGSAAGEKKDAKLVEKALLSIPYSLKYIKIFHSDRGNEYDNKLIDDVQETFEIERSLNNKGNPYNNAVSEAVNKIMKTEFIYQKKFETLEELQLELAEYVYWYNNLRIYGSLGYLTPMEYREVSTLKLAG